MIDTKSQPVITLLRNFDYLPEMPDFEYFSDTFAGIPKNI